MSDLLSVREAQARILSVFRRVEAELAPVEACAGRVLAEDVSAPGDLPPFDNSSMDGFAVRAADVRGASQDAPVILRITADIPAGAVTDAVIGPGQAARIMTGAPVPAGADAVVPVEDTDFSPALSTGLPGAKVSDQVAIYHPAGAGASIRPRGSDVKRGQLLLPKGRRIQPQDAGIMASIGLPAAQVTRRPRVALFSTGDEIIQPGQAQQLGQIYDANQYLLAGLMEREGAQVIRLGVAADDPQAVQNMLDSAVRQNVDLIVTSAGVSVGAFDFVRQIIEDHGALTFWKVNMRPGKPLAFGAYADIPFIGLPGNPVSAFVGCRVFVLPVIRALLGLEDAREQRVKAILAEPVESDGRESYLRAVVRSEGGKLLAKLTGHQGSGNLYSLVQANALLIVPSGVKSLPSGSEVEVWFLDSDR